MSDVANRLTTNDVRELSSSCGFSVQQTAAILHSGIAGTELKIGNTRSYSESHVRSAFGRTHVSLPILGSPIVVENLHSGVFVCRIQPRRDVTEINEYRQIRQWLGYEENSATSTNPKILKQQVDAIRMAWSVGGVNRRVISDRVCKYGYVPLVATVGTLVGYGLEIVGMDTELYPGRVAFEVRAPSDWYSRNFANRRLNAGAGGPWTWWYPREVQDVAPLALCE